MNTCTCTQDNYCDKAVALRNKEDIQYAIYVETTPFSRDRWMEYEIASSMRRLHRERALEVRDGV